MPPLVNEANAENINARRLAEIVDRYTCDAKDSLLAAKIAQSIYANISRRQDVQFKVGDFVYLSTSNQCREYTHGSDGHVAKFMPCFDGPYKITKVFPEKSTYTLLMPNSPNVSPTFHALQLCRFIPNDTSLFPLQELKQPQSIETDDREEWLVDRILDEKRGRKGREFLVRYCEYGAKEDWWLPLRDVDELEALDVWLALKESEALMNASACKTPMTTLRRCSPCGVQLLEGGRV
ncbi:hypothetical protein CCMSSC00406_0006748 [Pleurotus cornucopiae]|uniref:Uncharacterized protein n=1 Tax=Pleurotus cornucopiae TaxID=5321 RepID=A0ACB7IVN9_PLECO|nr:hypothetical protein CCMSSC00406_0006748 [Pleurotus cornucopiae]